MKQRIWVALGAMVVCLILVQPTEAQNTGRSALRGAAAGAVIGGVAGGRRGAAIGALVGAGTGARIAREGRRAHGRYYRWRNNCYYRSRHGNWYRVSLRHCR